MGSPGVRTISMGKPEIPVENQMVWEASENMGCDLR